MTQLETYIATEEAAPFSQVCDVWSPLYRSQTFPTVLKGLSGDENLMRSTATVAYDSLLPAWQWFLAHTGGKPIILIGDSQGATILIHLISAQLDHQPQVLRRLLVAILVGGNLQVPSGKVIGSTFTNVPLCTSATQTGCAIAFSSFSSFSSEPPANSVFGRPGQGTSLQAQETAEAGQQVACVNPAALGGGTGDLDPYLLTAPQIQVGLKEPVHTPWVTYPGLYSATCEHGGGATWLQVASLAGTSHTRPVVTEDILPGTRDTGPAWGFHGYEYNLTLGSLLHDVAGEEAAWQSSHLVGAGRRTSSGRVAEDHPQLGCITLAVSVAEPGVVRVRKHLGQGQRSIRVSPRARSHHPRQQINQSYAPEVAKYRFVFLRGMREDPFGKAVRLSPFPRLVIACMVALDHTPVHLAECKHPRLSGDYQPVDRDPWTMPRRRNRLEAVYDGPRKILSEHLQDCEFSSGAA